MRKFDPIDELMQERAPACESARSVRASAVVRECEHCAIRRIGGIFSIAFAGP